MKKAGHRVPKTLLVKMLKIQGLTLTRASFMGRRMWSVSDGKWFDSLYSVFKKYKYPKSKEMRAEIDPIVKAIYKAI